MEKLQVQKLGSFSTEFVDIDKQLDLDFKPGLYKQTKSFLEKQRPGLCSFDEHIKNMKFYSKINNNDNIFHKCDCRQ